MNKFLNAILLVSASCAASAFAHVEPGIFGGTTPNGFPCFFESKGTTHLGGVRHPLNERVTFMIDGAEFELGHPPILDEAAGTVRFNHDRFQGFRGIPGGAISMIIEMAHPEGEEGRPESITVYSDDWKDATKSTKVVCLKVVRQAK